MAHRRPSRILSVVLGVVLVGVGFAYAFWPRPNLVDMAIVQRGPMMLSIVEEGRTRVREAFVVSTPMDGRLLRVEVEPGDPVVRNATVVARMRPANPAALDVRTREQALAAVEAAQAALHVAEANLQAAQAEGDLAQGDLVRTERLAETGTASLAALDRAQGAARAAQARLDTARAAIEQRKAELQSAQAQLIGIDDRGLLQALDSQLGDELPIYAPTDGVILRVIHQDETTLGAGAPILEVGDIRDDLEVVAELVSSDAVQVSRGDPVIVSNWGGAGDLSGTVQRIDPFGQTRISALGVEEQRVTVVTRLSSPPERRQGLGHGYAVEVRIVIWQSEDVLKVPSSALFRAGPDWAVFIARDGRARQIQVNVGANNGTEAEILAGLTGGETVIVYPPPGLTDGAAVARREIGIVQP